ncbi:serine hydrolase domain-containing protein [Croceitalea marina]|uniref:Serine hydrolase domain-containing protein n=1 Tax=Croceitalea marina TaxID=1775166 RepID=A0ABW5MW41_9FLAO
MMKKNFKRYISIIAIIMVSPMMIYGQTKVSQELEQQIDSIFSTFKEQPGCAIAVAKNGKTLFQKGYGLANMSYNIPVTTETIFDVASNSKQFTAACIFLLEQEGKLEINDPIQKYLPEIPNYPQGDITIKNLIHHTSGVRSYLATLHSKNTFWGDSFNNEDAIKILARHKGLNFPTGTRYYYSNTNYALLASIVEKVSGQSLAEYAKNHLFKPLGMEHTFFKEKRDTIIKNVAIGYELNGESFTENHNYNATVVGDGGLHTNLQDFVRWSDNLKTGKVGGEQFIKRMITPGKLNNGEEISYAGGLFYENHYDIDGLPRVAHSGSWAGFRSLFYKFLNHDTSIILLSNNANTNVWQLLDQIVPLFLNEEITQARQGISANSGHEMEPLTLTNNQKKKFISKYYSTLNGYLREISLEDNRLVYKRPGANPVPLVAIAPNVLIYEHTARVKFLFDKNSFNSFVVTINDQEPMPYQKYIEHTYKQSDLKQFENNYYNEDVDEFFQIVAVENELQVLVKGAEIFRLQGIAEDIFTSEHSGYIHFERNQNNTITGFTRYDDHLYNLKHTIVKPTSS